MKCGKKITDYRDFILNNVSFIRVWFDFLKYFLIKFEQIQTN